MLILSLEFREVGIGEIYLGDISLLMVIKVMGKEGNYGGKEAREGKGV